MADLDGTHKRFQIVREVLRFMLIYYLLHCYHTVDMNDNKCAIDYMESRVIPEPAIAEDRT